MGQSAAGSAQQHTDHDAREPGHARLAHYGFAHRGQRRLARPFLQGRNAHRRRNAQEHAGSDGRYRPRAVGRPEGTLCVVRRSLPAAQGRRARVPRRSCRILSTSPTDFALSLCFRRRRHVFPRPVHVRCRRQSMERTELDGRLAVRRHQEHWRRRLKLPPTERRSRRRSPALPAWASTASAGEPRSPATRSGPPASTARSS